MARPWDSHIRFLRDTLQLFDETLRRPALDAVNALHELAGGGEPAPDTELGALYSRLDRVVKRSARLYDHVESHKPPNPLSDRPFQPRTWRLLNALNAITRSKPELDPPGHPQFDEWLRSCEMRLDRLERFDALVSARTPGENADEKSRAYWFSYFRTVKEQHRVEAAYLRGELVRVILPAVFEVMDDNDQAAELRELDVDADTLPGDVHEIFERSRLRTSHFHIQTNNALDPDATIMSLRVLTYEMAEAAIERGGDEAVLGQFVRDDVDPPLAPDGWSSLGG